MPRLTRHGRAACPQEGCGLNVAAAIASRESEKMRYAVPPWDGPTLSVRFYREPSGAEPVRDWLKSLPADERREIGFAIKTVQFGWPMGMPVVDHVAGERSGMFALAWRAASPGCCSYCMAARWSCCTGSSRKRARPRCLTSISPGNGQGS